MTRPPTRLRTGVAPLGVSPAGTPGYASFSWSSTTGAYFSVESSTNLAQGFTQVLQSSVLATPPTNQVSVPVTSGLNFYRLKF